MNKDIFKDIFYIIFCLKFALEHQLILFENNFLPFNVHFHIPVCFETALKTFLLVSKE